MFLELTDRRVGQVDFEDPHFSNVAEALGKSYPIDREPSLLITFWPCEGSFSLDLQLPRRGVLRVFTFWAFDETMNVYVKTNMFAARICENVQKTYVCCAFTLCEKI